MKAICALTISFVLGGIIMYGVVSAMAADMSGFRERLNRSDTLDTEFRRGIKTDLSEIRGLIIDLMHEKKEPKK